jgi:hypothetical protein
MIWRIKTKMKSLNTHFFIVLGYIFLVISCQSQQLGRKEYLKIKEIPTVNTEERAKVFLSYSIEKQIDIYLFATGYVEGSDTVFAEYLKIDGEEKIVPILQRLSKDDDIQDKTNLLRINKDCKCVAKNESFMGEIKKNIVIVNENTPKSDKMWANVYNLFLEEIIKTIK